MQWPHAIEHEVLPCGALYEKKIEILLNHKRDKNDFKNMNSLFLLVHCFKTIFCYILFNVSRLLFLLFGSMF